MHWKFVAFVTIIPLLAIQTAYAQSGKSDPMCEFACWISPSEAPASCGCKADGAKDKPVTSTPRTSPAPAPGIPTISDCRVMCEKNPLTAPEDCDCAGLIGGGGTGAAGGGTGPSVTAKSIAEDGMVSVDELLDYMIQLYRSRIAGVQSYYFLERTVVGQSESISRREYEPRVIPVANVQLAQKNKNIEGLKIKGVDTMIPNLVYQEKVMRGDHEAFLPLTPPQKAERQADTLEAPANAKPGELEAGRAVMKDPALVFELLGMAGAAADMRDQFRKEKDEESFANDVLEELLALKKAADADATAAVLARDATKKRGKKAAGLGGYRKLTVGWVRKGTLQFARDDVYCESPLGCTLKEFKRSLPKDVLAPDYEICMIWRSSKSIPSFSMKKGINSEQFPAHLWLPIPIEVLEAIRFAPKGTVISSEEDVDRPIRATVLFGGAADFMYWDRVYGDFRNIGKGSGDGPEMNVPHRIREQLRSASCPDSVDGERVLNLLVSGDSAKLKEMSEKVMSGKGDPEETCAVALRTAKVNVTDRIRQKFQVNKPLPSARAEAKMIYDEFGCIGQASDDPDSPCYGK